MSRWCLRIGGVGPAALLFGETRPSTHPDISQLWAARASPRGSGPIAALRRFEGGICDGQTNEHNQIRPDEIKAREFKLILYPGSSGRGVRPWDATDILALWEPLAKIKKELDPDAESEWRLLGVGEKKPGAGRWRWLKDEEVRGIAASANLPPAGEIVEPDAPGFMDGTWVARLTVRETPAPYSQESAARWIAAMPREALRDGWEYKAESWGLWMEHKNYLGVKGATVVMRASPDEMALEFRCLGLEAVFIVRAFVESHLGWDFVSLSRA
jgi:hypothetical protein